MLPSEEIERLESLSVERERQRYSNAELWEWLKRLKAGETEDIQVCLIAYRFAHDTPDNDGFWRNEWLRLCNAVSANAGMIDLLVWHLTKRGDHTVTGWIEQENALQRKLNAEAMSNAWHIVHGRLN